MGEREKRPGRFSWTVKQFSLKGEHKKKPLWKVLADARQRGRETLRRRCKCTFCCWQFNWIIQITGSGRCPSFLSRGMQPAAIADRMLEDQMKAEHTVGQNLLTLTSEALICSIMLIGVWICNRLINRQLQAVHGYISSWCPLSSSNDICCVWPSPQSLGIGAEATWWITGRWWEELQPSTESPLMPSETSSFVISPSGPVAETIVDVLIQGCK